MALCDIWWYCAHWIARYFIVLNDIAWCCVLSNGIAFYWYVYLVLYCMLLNAITLYCNHSENTHFTYPHVPTSPDVFLLLSAHATYLRLHLEIHSWTNLDNRSQCDTDPLMQAIWKFAYKCSAVQKRQTKSMNVYIAIDFTLHDLLQVEIFYYSSATTENMLPLKQYIWENVWKYTSKQMLSVWPIRWIILRITIICINTKFFNEFLFVQY